MRSVGTDKWEARCPSHDDAHASLSIGVGDDGRVLSHCHAGCDLRHIASAAGLRLSDFMAPRGTTTRTKSTPATIVAEYPYHAADGTLLYHVVRFEPKDFRQRAANGLWNMTGVPRVLYRLPQILAVPGADVLIVEGEKDVHAAESLGYLATCNPGGAGKWHRLAPPEVSGTAALAGRRVVIIPDADEPGRKHAAEVAAALGDTCDVRLVTLPGVKDLAAWVEAGGTAEQLASMIDTATVPGTLATSARKAVYLGNDEYRVVAESVAELARDPDVYQRGGLLVRVTREDVLSDEIRREQRSLIIGPLPTPNLRERLTKLIDYLKLNSKGEDVSAHPPAWLVDQISSRGEWPAVRPLRGVAEYPIIRRDGTVWQRPGYDPMTGVYYEPADGVPVIPEEINDDDADAALCTLLEVVCDFKFEAPEHRAAWLAGLLTPLARSAFDGPAPLFLIDANVRGAGKGLLSQIIGWIVLGREMSASSYAHDPDEMRKKITSAAMAGDRMIWLDNVEGEFGSDSLDRALTATRWKDRELGTNRNVDLPLAATWYATGNNVRVAADTIRRVLHIRLDVLEERPEERTGFVHADLMGYIRRRRPALLAAGITIVAAYLRALGNGMTRPKLVPFGSFEGWSSVVRESLVWLGQPDPYLTRAKLAESSDSVGESLAGLLTAWRAFDPLGTGHTTSEILSRCYPRNSATLESAAVTMRAAIEEIVVTRPGMPPTTRQLGNRLKAFRRRVVGGAYLVTEKNRDDVVIWRLKLVGDEA